MLNWLYEAVARVILFWHTIWASVFGSDTSDAAWVLSIVFLVITIRVLIFPLFMKQIRSQRAMQLLAPKIKELQAKHKGDRETLNKELMGLYKENKANPLAGCLPLLLQMPIFFALFHVLRSINPGRVSDLYGMPPALVDAAARAKFFGAPIAAAFTSDPERLALLGNAGSAVKFVAPVMVVLMGLTTFITQKQMMARAGATADPQQQNIQKILLYVMPLSFAVFGFQFPVGVLLYWLTTNLWAMAQQQYVIRKMPPPDAAATTSAAKPGKADKPVKADKAVGRGASPPSSDADAAAGADGAAGTRTAVEARPAVQANTPNRPRQRSGGSRASRKKRKG